MAHKVSLDSEGFLQEIAKALELTEQQVSRLKDEDVNISSMEEFYYLLEEDLENIFPGFKTSYPQKVRYRRWKEQFQLLKHPPPKV